MVRENADLLKRAGFTPIVEPVKESLGGLEKAIDSVLANGCQMVIVVNPYHGDHSNNAEAVQELLMSPALQNQEFISTGILLDHQIEIPHAIELYKEFNLGSTVTFIHAGFSEAKALVSELISQNVIRSRHAFIDGSSSKLYQRHFSDFERILIRDGFKRRTNREHPPVEPFSDLHITYKDEGMDGFGDFLIVGDDYKESGGPAYAVAIHISFIDSEKDDEMYVHHFLSERVDTPTDPAGKFYEALTKLVAEVDRDNTNIFRTKAIEEFIGLFEKRHFPGLGYSKKLSMQHHIETLARYFSTPE